MKYLTFYKQQFFFYHLKLFRSIPNFLHLNLYLEYPKDYLRFTNLHICIVDSKVHIYLKTQIFSVLIQKPKHILILVHLFLRFLTY